MNEPRFTRDGKPIYINTEFLSNLDDLDANSAEKAARESFTDSRAIANEELAHEMVRASDGAITIADAREYLRTRKS